MKFSAKTALLCLTLLACWYFGFRLPVNRQLGDISAQTAALESKIAEQAGAAAAMNTMEAALAAGSAEGPSVAPYDNLEGVLAQLNTALAGASDYSLRFSDPVTGKDGSVRRSVVLQFSCDSFDQARKILAELTAGPWLCQISGLTLRASSGLGSSPLTASATVTFFESAHLT